MANTIYSMGTSLLTWTQALHRTDLFAEDARVIGLTSEGNEVAWKGCVAVSAANVALEAISRSIAVEFACYTAFAPISCSRVLRILPRVAFNSRQCLCESSS